MKLIVQIPCWNEDRTLGETIASLPTELEGVDRIEVLVVDDGSSDRTVEVAKEAGAHHVVRMPRHVGLAGAFSAGVEAAIERDADILVNTDADMQYPSEHIQDLIRPVVNGEADMAIGNRLDFKPRPFSLYKMLLERLGTMFVRIFSGLPVRDAASGFRAFSRDALEAMFIHGRFSYTLESLILAGMQRFRVANVPISINPPKRRSRLFKSIPTYIVQSSVAVIRAYLMYHPLKFFVGVGSVFLVAALLLGVRYLVFVSMGEGQGHIQSLILMAILAFMGFQTIILGLIGDVLSANRRLLERIRIAHVRGGSEQNDTRA